MAARIPLILSQPARRDAEAIDLIENIVAAAMLVPGLDANLVGDIASFELGGTDHLCLLGHTRDIVLASFLELPDAEVAWQRLDQRGHFVDFASDEAAVRKSLPTSPGLRRVFYYRLRLGLPPAELLDRCARLLAAQHLNLVSIRLEPAKTDSAAGAANAVNPAASRTEVVPTVLPQGMPPAIKFPVHSQPAGNSQPVPSSRSNGDPLRPSVAVPLFPISSEPVHARVDGDDDDRQWSELDKLVDDLGAMDL